MREYKLAAPQSAAEEKVYALIAGIEPADREAMRQARERQDSRLKVPGSLGRLEDIGVRLAGMTGKVTGNDVRRQAVIIMSADNGVVEEGVASAPQTVTLMQTINFTRRITGIGSQAAYFGIDILDIDCGVALPIPEECLTKDMLTAEGRLAEKVVDRRIANGTRNLAKEPAMTREQAIEAFLIGFEAADAVKAAGIRLAGVGEMGIGNSTTGACLISALTGAKAAAVIGRGGGLDDEGLGKKAKVVDDAVAKYNCDDPIEMARCMGGFDICAMAGAYLGLARHRIPTVIDGYISIAGALLAKAICPTVTDYMFTSHRSEEQGYALAAAEIGIPPMFDLGMKLGEASGCPIAFKIIEAGTAIIDRMKSLAEGQIDHRYLDELRERKFL